MLSQNLFDYFRQGPGRRRKHITQMCMKSFYLNSTLINIFTLLKACRPFGS